ncbi:MAG: serine/threonine protein kinase [Gemmataceae bacterium]|nr:serine/threonine protein kinase [Gemmataceae bacterium]
MAGYMENETNQRRMKYVMDTTTPISKSDPESTAPQTTQPIDPADIDWSGQVIGDFRVLHRLGKGGMGHVYLAEQTSLKRKVALKLLHPELADSDRSLQRFKAEAQNAARATHANIVQIYTIDRANGVNYIALEYVEGKNLREFIERKGPPELSLGLHIMNQVAAALQRACELGIIHRDIKPENIMLTRKGEVKVADFGLSRNFSEANPQPSLTQSQVTMGTPLYMSPEQVERRPVDVRTDIYSFGVTSYHMFAGQPPFRGTSPIDVAYHHVHSMPQPLAEIRPDLPADLCAIIHKMMAKKPEDRYQSPREIVRDINKLQEAHNLSTVASISFSASFLGSKSDGLRAAPFVPWTVPSQHSPWLLRSLFVLSVLFALYVGGVFAWLRNHGPSAAKDPVPPHHNGPLEDPLVTKKADNGKMNEKEMRRLVEEHLRPETQLDVLTGMNHASKLGLYYVREHRLDDADALFSKLLNTDRKQPAYQFLGRLGRAMVLAFKNDSAASNQAFLAVIADVEKWESRVPVGFLKKPRPLGKKDAGTLEEELLAYEHLWRLNPQMRGMVANALQYNQVNSPQDFPARLEPYRHPPRPTLKAAPMPMPMPMP